MAVPKLDAELASFSTNFLAVASEDPEAFHLTEPQLAEYAVAREEFVEAYYASRAGSSSRGTVARKNDAKRRLKFLSSALCGLVKASDASDQDKVRAGVHVNAPKRRFVAAPEAAPLLVVTSVIGRAVRVRLTDAEAPNTRRRPAGARGAVFSTFVGEHPPDTTRDVGWRLAFQTGRTSVQIVFPNDVPPGVACWVRARWYSNRGDYSPASVPVYTYLQVGPVYRQAG